MKILTIVGGVSCFKIRASASSVEALAALQAKVPAISTCGDSCMFTVSEVNDGVLTDVVHAFSRDPALVAGQHYYVS